MATEPVKVVSAVRPEWRQCHGPSKQRRDGPLRVCPSHLDAAQLWGPEDPDAALSTRERSIERPDERLLFTVTTQLSLNSGYSHSLQNPNPPPQE